MTKAFIRSWYQDISDCNAYELLIIHTWHYYIPSASYEGEKTGSSPVFVIFFCEKMREKKVD